MGTSVNQSSPRTLNWKAAQAGYRDPSVSVNRIASEVWRAALNQETGNIAQLLSQPIVARIGALVAESSSSMDLARKSAFEIARSKQSSLATELARRACIQVAGARDGPAAFTARLFAEATAYLVSRDLPGFVGLGRLHDVAQSTTFKSSLSQYAAEVATRAKHPSQLTERNWPDHVKNVIRLLRGSR